MLYRFVSGDFPITLVLYLVLWLWARGQVSLLRQLTVGDTPVWNWIGRLTLGIAGLFPLWVALFDNWRQLLGYALSPRNRWQSDPFDTALTAVAVRDITLALLAIWLIGAALLFVRHRGSIPLLVLAGVIGVACVYFLNPIRIRLDVYLYGTRAALTDPQPIDAGFVLFWAVGVYGLIALLIAAGAAALFAAVAVPVRLGYWLATRGRVADEAAVFQVYRRQARSLHDPQGRGTEPAPPADRGPTG